MLLFQGAANLFFVFILFVYIKYVCVLYVCLCFSWQLHYKRTYFGKITVEYRLNKWT